MRPTDCSETSVINYQYMMPNTAEDRRSRSLVGASRYERYKL